MGFNISSFLLGVGEKLQTTICGQMCKLIHENQVVISWQWLFESRFFFSQRLTAKLLSTLTDGSGECTVTRSIIHLGNNAFLSSEKCRLLRRWFAKGETRSMGGFIGEEVWRKAWRTKGWQGLQNKSLGVEARF